MRHDEGRPPKGPPHAHQKTVAAAERARSSATVADPPDDVWVWIPCRGCTSPAACGPPCGGWLPIAVYERCDVHTLGIAPHDPVPCPRCLAVGS